MSTAVMHTPAFYDFDLLLKNQQLAPRNTTHMSSLGTSSPPTVACSNTQSLNVNNNNNNINSNILNNNSNTIASHLNNNNNNLSSLSLNGGAVGATQQNAAAMALQHQINAAVAAQQAQVNQHHHHQQQQNLLIHNALQRAVSHPHGGAAATNQVVSLVNSLIENLGHRKLERTQSEPLPQQVNTSRYKTELCRPYEEAGECKYGDKCQFAHGFHELRNLQRHPKYKTELCRTFHSVGFCPYGPRCHFVHNAEEAQAHNRMVNEMYQRMEAEQAAANQAHQNRRNNHSNHLPLSPPISMSTGSDRASPTGSLSLSPTNSMASFFPDQQSPNQFNQQAFVYPNSPPCSPRELSPISSPPPSAMSCTSSTNQQTTSCSSASSTSSQSVSPSQLCEEARLPVFNRLSSAIDAFTNMAI